MSRRKDKTTRMFADLKKGLDEVYAFLGGERKGYKVNLPKEESREQILAAVDRAEASLARGEGREITEESMRRLAEEVNRRGRVRLAATRKPPSRRG